VRRDEFADIEPRGLWEVAAITTTPTLNRERLLVQEDQKTNLPRRLTVRRAGAISRAEFDLAIIVQYQRRPAVARDRSLRGPEGCVDRQGEFCGSHASRSSKLDSWRLRFFEGSSSKTRVRSAARARALENHSPRRIWCIRFKFCFQLQPRGFHASRGDGLTLLDCSRGCPFKGLHSESQRCQGARRSRAQPRRIARGRDVPRCVGDGTRAYTLEKVLARICRVRRRESRRSRVSVLPTEDSRRRGARCCSAALAVKSRRRNFLNAGGPWVDTIRRMDDTASKRCVRLTTACIRVCADVLPVRESLVSRRARANRVRDCA